MRNSRFGGRRVRGGFNRLAKLYVEAQEAFELKLETLSQDFFTTK